MSKASLSESGGISGPRSQKSLMSEFCVNASCSLSKSMSYDFAWHHGSVAGHHWCSTPYSCDNFACQMSSTRSDEEPTLPAWLAFLKTVVKAGSLLEISPLPPQGASSHDKLSADMQRLGKRNSCLTVSGEFIVSLRCYSRRGKL